MNDSAKKIAIGQVFMGMMCFAALLFLTYMGFEFGVWLKG